MDYALHILILALLWASLALSQGLVTGYLGVLAVHQAAAWGIGAYTAAILDRVYGLSLAEAIIPSAITAGLATLVLGRLIGGGRRDDQVVASLCVQLLVTQALLNLTSVTGGPFGIAGIGSEDGSQDERRLYAFAASAGLLTACVVLYGLIERTRLPRAWKLVRDDRPFAESLGIDAGRSRSIALFAAGLIAGPAGAIFAHYLTFIEPSTFGLPESVAILAIAVIGRAPSIAGVIVAAAAITALPEALRSIGLGTSAAANLRQILFGIFIVVAMFGWGRR